MPAGKNSTPTLLIIDDEVNTREGLQKAFSHKYRILLAEDASKGIEILGKKQVDVVLTDLRMPGLDGMTFTKEVTKKKGAPLVIMLTAYGSVQTAVDAMKVGAYDYLTKPVNLDNLEMVIDRGLESRQLRTENQQLKQELDRQYGFENIIGESEAMLEVFETVRQAAEAKSTVLLTGESGTGKELIAHALHRMGSRCNSPFIVVHCASLSSNLLESELFGHEKGAYTGAHEQTPGRFERADGGTLFLDEIGEIDAATQIKLLRVLESKTFERVGGSEPIQVDVRLLAATNRNLKKAVHDGTFREDLYFRLNVVNIHLPPLRERTEDIPLLLEHYLKISGEENGKRLEKISSEATALLSAYSWPGNIRELRNCVERMVVMTRANALTVSDVPTDVRTAIGESLGPSSTESKQKEKTGDESLDIDTQERNLIIKALRETGGNRSEAAKRLGISRRTLHRRLHTYDLTDM